MLEHIIGTFSSVSQENLSYVRAQVVLDETIFDEHPEKDIKPAVDECVIEVEAKSSKGDEIFSYTLH